MHAMRFKKKEHQKRSNQVQKTPLTLSINRENRKKKCMYVCVYGITVKLTTKNKNDSAVDEMEKMSFCFFLSKRCPRIWIWFFLLRRRISKEKDRMDMEREKYLSCSTAIGPSSFATSLSWDLRQKLHFELLSDVFARVARPDRPP